jgi:hypothetical protein
MMILSSSTPTRARVVQGDYYPEDFAFQMPRPFNESNVAQLADELGASASGLANQMNQVLAENLGNLLSARIKKVVKFNEDLEKAQAEGKQLDVEPLVLPYQEDLDKMVESYDFSGVRATSGTSEESFTPLERIVYAYARKLIRGILKTAGLASAGLKAPVTVPKSRDAEPGPNQISWDDFEDLVAALAEGTGVWGESAPHMAKRAEILESAAAEFAAKRRATQAVQDSLGV